MSVIIKRRMEIYLKTKSGKNWKNKPEMVKEEIITEKFYNNFIDSIPFFNRFGEGASCRGYKGYTYIGYKPIKVITVSPGKEKKIVDTFTFEIKH